MAGMEAATRSLTHFDQAIDQSFGACQTVSLDDIFKTQYPILDFGLSIRIFGIFRNWQLDSQCVVRHIFLHHAWRDICPPSRMKNFMFYFTIGY